MKTKSCPKCGKPMREWPAWPGLWVCPDYARPLNDAPPFQFKCTGLVIGKRAAKAFAQELARMSQARN